MYWIDASSSVSGGNQKTFCCDTESDINNLPTTTTEGAVQAGNNVVNQRVEMGSKCMVVETGELYILGSSNTWDKVGG